MSDYLNIYFTDDIQDWMLWGYYISPMMYGQNAIAINEFLAERWSAVSHHASSKSNMLID